MRVIGGTALARVACLLLLVIPQGCASTRDAAARWDLGSLHPEVRRRIHLRAVDVPSFPRENPALRNPRRWPRTMTIQGRRCVLQIHGAEHGRSAMLPRSIDDIQRLSPFTLFYTEPGSSSTEEVGPAYMWSSPGRLVRRSWSEVRGGFRLRQEYGYHDSGELFLYAESHTRQNPRLSLRYDRFSEFFDRKGRLVGASYTRQDARGRTTEVHYKNGKRIPYPAFEREEAVR